LGLGEVIGEYRVTYRLNCPDITVSIKYPWTLKHDYHYHDTQIRKT